MMVLEVEAMGKISQGVDVDREEGRRGKIACIGDSRGLLAEAEGKADSVMFWKSSELKTFKMEEIINSIKCY